MNMNNVSYNGQKSVLNRFVVHMIANNTDQAYRQYKLAKREQLR